MEGKYEGNSYYPTLSEIRELNQSVLETFTFILENKFDEPVDRLVKLIEKEKKTIVKDLKEFPKQKIDPENYDSETFDFELGFERHEKEINIYIKEEQLKALLEMKIVYAFKFLEINLKEILSRTFNIKNTRNLFNWNSIERFLEDRNVKIKNIKGYQEIYQLKQVNNSIKHSEKLEEKTLRLMFTDEEFNKIPEMFELGKLITYEHLLNFYKRVEPFIKIFLENLCEKIYEELYIFNEDKLERIAYNLVLRMERKDAMTLIEKIKGHY